MTVRATSRLSLSGWMRRRLLSLVYAYDATFRLTRVVNDSGDIVSYSYDEDGNVFTRMTEEIVADKSADNSEENTGENLDKAKVDSDETDTFTYGDKTYQVNVNGKNKKSNHKLCGG